MRIGWRGALGIALSVALLWWAFRGVEWSKVADGLRRANLGLMVLSAAVATTIFPLRARRWQTILEPVAAGVSLGKLWRSIAIGMMVNNVAFARAGEPARAFALTREEPRVSFAASFASLAVDRIFDALVIFGLMFAAMLDPRFPRGMLSGGVLGGTGIVGMAAVTGALYLIVFFPDRTITLYELFARRVAPRFEERGKRLLVAFAQGLSVLRSPGRFVSVLWWTLLHWLVNAFAFWIAFKAVGIHAPFSATLFLQGIIAIGVALPSTPGFFGVWEAAAQAGLTVFGVPKDLALTWAVGFHILSFIPITVIGIYYFLRLGLSLEEIGRSGDGKDDAPTAGDPGPDVADRARTR
jgi:glycosyltransferase 2 family protein